MKTIKNLQEVIMSEYVSAEQFLNNLKAVDYIKFKNISLNWSEVVTECESIQQAHPEFMGATVWDNDKFEPWDKQGKDLAEQFESYRQYGYTQHSTRAWKSTFKQPKLELSWEGNLEKHLPFEQCISTATMQPPGVIMPWHKDGYVYFRRLTKDQNKQYIRFLVFLKDWEVGHLLQIGNSMLTHWSAGDTVVWHPDVYHLAANCGLTNKWTCNITGILKDNFVIG